MWSTHSAQQTDNDNDIQFQKIQITFWTSNTFNKIFDSNQSQTESSQAVCFNFRKLVKMAKLFLFRIEIHASPTKYYYIVIIIKDFCRLGSFLTTHIHVHSRNIWLQMSVLIQNFEFEWTLFTLVFIFDCAIVK